ncbi:beta-N-acetylhexosaminidase [Formosa sediminum]|uniref:beta-N-acetylhexosaminidase n=1 Tax=Formosa sediminum TaxID=2594004 RepID=A0A516GWL3_9FLAO|nr:beta-N-acetylhexosaminidase [Formosa sediminum]
MLSFIVLSCSNKYDKYKSINHTIDDYNIIPKPSNLQILNGSFKIDDNTVVYSDSVLNNETEYLIQTIKNITNFSISSLDKNFNNTHIINLELTDTINSEEGYVLDIAYDRIDIKAKTTKGAFYAIETLKQLILNSSLNSESQEYLIPALHIKDEPRFSHRGMMLDTGRYFYDVEFIKQFIDLIAVHKMNIFHWHLTEDQGWRIEIKKYPKLTEVGAWRNGTEIGRTPGTKSDNIKHGGFYSQDQIKDIINYAKKKHITIIPEIDMPGHNGAAIASYPFLSCFPDEVTPMNDNIISEKTKELLNSGVKKVVQESWGIKSDVLCAGKESTYTFYENVLAEVADLFPSEYIHIGGDECLKDNWKRCPNCQHLIEEKDLKGEEELQSYFINHMSAFLKRKGKKIIGWDEILEGQVTPEATVMSWRGVKGGIQAAKQGQNVIMTPREPYYLDYYQVADTLNEPLTVGGRGPNTVKDIYLFNPLPKELTETESKNILGIQGNLWTEYIATPNYAEYMLLPRMTAISEVAWYSGDNKKDYEEFLKRLNKFEALYSKMGVNYAKHVFE